MYVELEDLKTGWYQIFCGLRDHEIDILIERLTLLKKNKDQHFHITSNYEGDSGIADIEFYIQDSDETNMMITSPAISPNR
ncbi:MAG: hypothetical protein PVJ11_08640 [Syntrophobacterales bacterium]|jgi:hypothetical protein